MVLKLISEDRAQDGAGRIWVRVGGRRWSEASVQPVVTTRKRGGSRSTRMSIAPSLESGN